MPVAPQGVDSSRRNGIEFEEVGSGLVAPKRSSSEKTSFQMPYRISGGTMYPSEEWPSSW